MAYRGRLSLEEDTEIMRIWSMALAAAGGVLGAAGVALAAAGAHGGDKTGLATIAADFLLFHAAAIIALTAAVLRDRLVNAAASFLALGAVLFSGELALHAFAGLRPVPVAAPLGGALTIVGWLLAAVALPRAVGRRH